MKEDIAWLASCMQRFEEENECQITMTGKWRTSKQGFLSLQLDVLKSGEHFEGEVWFYGLEGPDLRVSYILLPDIP